MRVAHREGLAREDAKLLNRREEIRLVQRRQQEAHRAVRAAQAAKHLVAVNVVNCGFGVAAQKVVQIALERRDGKRAVRVQQMGKNGAFVGQMILKLQKN